MPEKEWRELQPQSKERRIMYARSMVRSPQNTIACYLRRTCKARYNSPKHLNAFDTQKRAKIPQKVGDFKLQKLYRLDPNFALAVCQMRNKSRLSLSVSYIQLLFRTGPFLMHKNL